MNAMQPLPLLPTMGVGSYASPGWFVSGRARMREGDFGPADIEEMFEDATRLAIADQIEALYYELLARRRAEPKQS